MKKIILLNKKEGETPLEALGRFRVRNKKYKDVKMTYAGRLDPMAEGLLLVLVGEEIYLKEKYLELDKEYEFEVLFGFSTDTHDILGKIRNFSVLQKTEIDLKNKIKKALKKFKGKFVQNYPVYSSRTVAGKPLWEYGRENMTVELPAQEVIIKKLEFKRLRHVYGKKLLQEIVERIGKVKGDFRQQEILTIWRQTLRSRPAVKFVVAKFNIKCSSGTYVRALAESLGKGIGEPALAYKIKRTKIGKFAKIKI